MNNLKDGFLNFFKKETIFSISLILAIVSCFFVLPNRDYLNYINWETIILLFAIMLIVEILKNLSVFEILVRKLLDKVKNTRGLVLFLVFTCFFSSIFITNDVSLIIFVPFTLLALKKVERLDLIIFAVSLETIAANVGCMVLPIGAPHNIVMYTVSHIPEVSLPRFGKIEVEWEGFLKRVFLGVDYYLLLTFIALFVLIGNLQCIPFFNSLFKQWIIGNEVIFGVLSSQIISNVPAAILLSGFSTNYEAIIVGINIGGLGTLIASMANLISYSMANLISYKILAREFNDFKIRYLIVFTVLNIALLLILLAVYFLTN